MVPQSHQSGAERMTQDVPVAEPDAKASIVLADVGGTNVRFAVLAGSQLGGIEHLSVADFPQFNDALDAFLSRRTDIGPVRHALFGVAGVVDGGRCTLTNSAWTVDADELRVRFGFADVHLVNDFEAVAWALPHFGSNELRKLGGGDPKVGAPMLALGPGTGLGVAAYVPRDQDGFVLHTEAGHTTLPSGSVREDAILGILRKRYGHVSAERVLSGQGLENLYRAIATLDSLSVPARSAAEITKMGLTGSCVASRAAIDAFCAILGEVAGNLALALAAQGGVFIAGGIALHLRDYLAQSQFRARFEAKGRMSSYVAPIPAFLILHGDPAFVGLRVLAARRGWNS